MSLELLRLAAAMYLVAAAGYVVYFARPRHLLAARFGAWLLGFAWVVHFVAIGLACKEFGGLEWFTLRGGFVLMAWVLAGAYLAVLRYYHLPSVGAFVTPMVLLVLAPTLFEGGPSGFVPVSTPRSALTFHVMTGVGSLAIFGIAFGVSVMYLLQEREVKGKRFGALFSRLPALQALDTINQRAVRLGFVIFTVAILGGSALAHKVWRDAWWYDPQQVRAVVLWLACGVMVQLHRRGWHGRRFAWLSASLFVVMIASWVALRTVPGATLHTGTYAPAALDAPAPAPAPPPGGAP